MTVITVIVESTFSGPADGFLGIKIDDSLTVSELITQFCQAKKAPKDPYYTLIMKHNVMLVNNQPISDFFIHDGQVLRLVRRNPSSSKLLSGQWFIVAAIGFFVAIVGQTTCVLLFSVFRTVPNNFALVLDAGPFSTDIILYSWPGEKNTTTGDVMMYSSCSAMGSITQVDPDKMAEYFDECFEDLHELVLKESKNDVDVFFGATVEMRMLSQTNPARATLILSRVQSYLESSNWKFRHLSVDILHGSVEGVNQWISANYYGQTVREKGSVNDTIGTLKLDDTSAFVSFEVPETLKDASDVFSSPLFSNDYQVFSQSHECYGRLEAMRRYRAFLIIKSGDGSSNIINSPCEPLNGTFEAENTYFSSICVETDLMNFQTKNTWTFIGTGNDKECEGVVSKLISYQECNAAKLDHCIDPSRIPTDFMNHNFYAFSAFNSIAQSLGIQPGLSMTEARRHVKVMCDYSQEELKLVNLSNTKNARVAPEHLCFEGQYMFGLLTQVYGFNSEAKWGQVAFISEMGMEWPQGYMLNATQAIADVPSKPRINVLTFTLLTILFVIVLALSIGFIVHGLKLRKSSEKYQRKQALLMDRELEKFIEPYQYDQEH